MVNNYLIEKILSILVYVKNTFVKKYFKIPSTTTIYIYSPQDRYLRMYNPFETQGHKEDAS